ncbi:MAG: RNA polymerase sigma factor [Acidimicrobiia bacterium]
MIQRSLVDGSAFALVFDRHFASVYRFLAAHWGHEVGGDLASETFVLAFDQRSRFDTTRVSARPWLFGIALNLSRMEARRRRREADATARGATRDELEDFAEELVNRMDAVREASDLGISPALRRLRAEDLTVLAMSVFGEMSHREIAEALNLPAGTVKSRLHRTVKTLRALLGTES